MTDPAPANIPEEFRSRWLLAAGLLTALTFALEWITPLGVAIPALYILVVHFAAFTLSRRAVWISAGLATILTFAGAAVSPEDDAVVSLGWLNRTLALAGVWTMAAANLLRLKNIRRRRQLEQQLLVSRDQLSERSVALMSMMEDLQLKREALERETEQRMRAAQARAESDERFRVAMDGAPVAMIMVDEAGKIVLANPQAERDFGYESRKLLGRGIELLVPDHVREKHPELRDSFNENPHSRAMGPGRELTARRRDGSEFPVEIGLNPLQTSEGRFVLCAIVDVTERIALMRRQQTLNEELERRVEERTRELSETEARLRQRAAELETSNRELDQFAYAASHDLKSPLRGIQNLATWVLEDCGQQLPEESLEDLKLLTSRAARLEALLESLLAYSRIGRKEGAPEAVDTGKLIAGIVDLLAAPPAFEFEIQENLPVVQAPRAALERVFGNLIGNALKHHDREDGRISVTCASNETMHRFTIADDGPGIAPEFHKRIFRMFETLKPRDELEGSGMGLSLVQKTLQIHGGRIEINSNQAAGTEFHVSWPVNPPEKAVRDLSADDP